MRLTFIDKGNENHILEVKANQRTFDIGAKKLREFFGIEYAENLGDVFQQFYQRFGNSIPQTRPAHLGTDLKDAAVKRLNRNDNDNAMCCYEARRNGIRNGVQCHRTPFNSDKTKLLREPLYDRLGGDNTISFYYREHTPLSDTEIIDKFMQNDVQNAN